MARNLVILGFALVAIVPLLQAYNILLMMPFASKSHRNIFDPVMEELAKRGHKVTVFSNLEGNKEVPGITNYFSVGLKNIFERHNLSFFQGSANGLTILKTMFNVVYDMTNITYSDPFIQNILKEPRNPSTGKPKFDLLVMDACLNDFVLPIGHHMGVPAFIFSSGPPFVHHAWNLNVPYPYSVLPAPTVDLPEEMSFLQRAFNAFSSFAFVMALNHLVLPNEDAIVRQYLPNSPSIVDLERNVAFMIANAHPAISVRRPLMPYSLEIGGINCNPAKPLPKDLEDYLQGAGRDGVIYFSLGTVASGQSMPMEMRDKVIKAFSKLPQKVLWKFENEIPSLPKNVKLIKWAPQQDLLAHPQLKLFITHGGLLSTSEAAYHGCPIIGFPLSVDQEGNIAQATHRGVAEYLNWRTFTSDQLLETIKRMITDKSYKEKSMKSSALLKDRALNPVHEAAYWIEYVIRHDGAPFLKTSAGSLNFFQYFLLDVFAVSFVAVSAVIALLVFILRRLLRFIGRMLGINSSPNASGKKKLQGNGSKRKKKD